MLLSALLFLKLLFFFAPQDQAEFPASIYDYKVTALDGTEIDFGTFRGKKILIVNTASECGYTPQYAALEKLHKAHPDNLVIVGFPANDFGRQEPGSNKEIAAFCKQNYGVTFPMAEKITVKGDEMAPIYRWLTDRRLNGVRDSKVKWNFQKYLIDETGRLVEIFNSAVKPDSPEMLSAIRD